MARHDQFFREMLCRGVFRVDAQGGVWRQLKKVGGSWQPMEPRKAAHKNQDNYLRVMLTQNGQHRTIGAHWLVWMAYGNRPSHGHEINHLNGVRDDNHIANLEMVTPGDNQRHSYRALGRSVAGEANGRHKLTRDDVLDIRRRSLEGESRTCLAKEYGVTRTAIRLAIQHKNWSTV